MYINLLTKQYPVYLSEIKKQFPNTSFPTELSDSSAREFGYALIYPCRNKPTFNCYKQRLIKANAIYVADEDKYYEVYEVQELLISAQETLLNEAKKQKFAQIQAWTQAAITDGFTSNCTGVQARFDSDIDTQITMQGIALNVNTEQFKLEYPAGCPVRGYELGADVKTIFMLTAAQVLQFCADLSKHIGTQKQHGWELQQAVAAATTADELEAIIW